MQNKNTTTITTLNSLHVESFLYAFLAVFFAPIYVKERKSFLDKTTFYKSDVVLKESNWQEITHDLNKYLSEHNSYFYDWKTFLYELLCTTGINFFCNFTRLKMLDQHFFDLLKSFVWNTLFGALYTSVSRTWDKSIRSKENK